MRIDLKAVLIDKLVLGIAPVQRRKVVIGNVFIRDIVLDADELAHDVRRLHIQAYAAVVIDGREFP